MLESLEVLSIGPAHSGCHEWRHQARETGRLAAIPQRHPSTRGVDRGPRVGRGHWERSFGGAHHQSRSRCKLDNLVGVGKPPAEKLGDECDLGADGKRRSCFPLHRFDIHIPRGGVIGIGGETRRGRSGARQADRAGVAIERLAERILFAGDVRAVRGGWWEDETPLHSPRRAIP